MLSSKIAVRPLAVSSRLNGLGRVVARNLRMKEFVLTGLATMSLAGGSPAADVEKEARFKSATMACDGKTLTIGTGKVTREWWWTGKGWLTSNVVHRDSRKTWQLADTSRMADWQVPGVAGEGQLVSVATRQSDDEGFTSEHLEVVSTVFYPLSAMEVQHVVWAYPDAPGLRTQLRLKRTAPVRNAPVAVRTAVAIGEGGVFSVVKTGGVASG